MKNVLKGDDMNSLGKDDDMDIFQNQLRGEILTNYFALLRTKISLLTVKIFICTLYTSLKNLYKI